MQIIRWLDVYKRQGHDKEHSGFWISNYTYYGHAHNMFLQIAYDYGIIPGILFLLIYLYSLYRAFRLCLKGNWTCIVFLLAILCFGMAEMVPVSYTHLDVYKRQGRSGRSCTICF